MTEIQTFAWILLSVPDSPGTLEDIIAVADGINHAIPTHHELQRSLGWLQARGLVRKAGRRYCTTEAGSQLLARVRKGSRTMMGTWELVATELESQRGALAEPEDITPEETSTAYHRSRKSFRKAYEELRKRDGDA